MKNYNLMLIAVTLFVSVASSSTFYVSPSGSHTIPYNSLVTASTNIQSAVSHAAEGDTVLVDDGLYSLSSEIAVSNAITVRGINGHTSVVIDGNNAVRCFRLLDVECVLVGLTLANGFAGSSDGGGVYCESSLPVISNCYVTSCSAGFGGGIAYGNVMNTFIINNTAGDGGGLGESTAYNCLIVSNSSTDFGGGASICVLNNCTVVDNHTDGDGGGGDSCEFVNCIIYYNTASGSDNNISFDYGVTYSCSPELSSGDDWNITSVPGFVSRSLGNYRLTGASLCKDAGNNSGVQSLDLDGKPRIVNTTVDMGAYEIQVTPSDTDGDGMKDSWEVQFFGNISAESALDADFDLFSNLSEYIAGTDPTNPASYFAVTNWLGGSFIVQWPSVPGRIYEVSWAGSLTNSFQSLESLIDYPQNSYTDTTHSAGNAGFYKVNVRLDP